MSVDYLEITAAHNIWPLKAKLKEDNAQNVPPIFSCDIESPLKI